MLQSIPTSRSRRWKFCRDVASSLFAKRKRTSDYTAKSVSKAEEIRGAKFPAAVREWYAVIDEIGDYWSGQDRMWLPRNAEAEDGYCLLMVENQGCFRMGHRVSDDSKTDPPVYRFNEGNFRLSPSVSMFAIQMLIMEAALSAKHSFFHFDGIDNKTAKKIEHTFKKSVVPDFPLWTGPTRFMCDRDVVVRLDYPDGLRGESYVGVAAKTKSTFNDIIKQLHELGVETET